MTAIPLMGNVNWHLLRHSNATLLDSIGTPLGALLGHSSSEITRPLYLHSRSANRRGAVEKLEALLIGPQSDPKFTNSTTGASRNVLKLQEILVGARGFEPRTPCAQGRCATRLRYAPT